MLANLQTQMGGPDFAVVTVATGRNSPQAIERFFGEIGVTNLPLYTDPQNELARPMGVMGLPVTLILDREGREIARLTGDAHWDGADALAILRRISVMTRGAHTQGARLDTGTALADADPAGRLR